LQESSTECHQRRFRRRGDPRRQRVPHQAVPQGQCQRPRRRLRWQPGELVPLCVGGGWHRRQGGGSHRVGIRLSPFMDYMDSHDSDPHALGLHMATKLSDHDILYLHMIKPRMALVNGRPVVPHRLLPYREAFKGTFIANGGYDREEGDKAVT
uniref:Uncharacterized protein n=1 Tax=Triticum urartu TaxID=4572 RepID=A0A8R7P936_TRIUA